MNTKQPYTNTVLIIHLQITIVFFGELWFVFTFIFYDILQWFNGLIIVSKNYKKTHVNITSTRLWIRIVINYFAIIIFCTHTRER